MKKIMFVCLGNICRSPMAEYLLRDLADKRGVPVFTASAATCSDEVGNPVYPPAKRMLAAHAISCEGKRAMQLTPRDYQDYDYLIGMEQRNIHDILRITGGDPAGKVFRLLDLSDHPRDIADPWYTGDFTKTWKDLSEGCELLLKKLQAEG